jgi:hypothetical protein
MDRYLPTNSPVANKLPLEQVYVGLQEPEVTARLPIVSKFLDIGLDMTLRNLREGRPDGKDTRTSPWPSKSEVLEEIKRLQLDDKLTEGKFKQYWNNSPIRFHKCIGGHGLVAARPWLITKNAADALIDGVKKVASGDEDFDKVVLRVCRITNKSRSLAPDLYALQLVMVLDHRFKDHIQRVNREITKAYFDFWLETLMEASSILNLEIGEDQLRILCRILTIFEDGSMGTVFSTGDKSHFDVSDGMPLLYDLFMKYFPAMMEASRGRRIEEAPMEEVKRALAKRVQ